MTVDTARLRELRAKACAPDATPILGVVTSAGSAVHRPPLAAYLEALAADAPELLDELDALRASPYFCVSCGQDFGQGAAAEGELMAHIRVCESHPMRALEAELEKLREENGRTGNALLALVSAQNAELERLCRLEEDVTERIIGSGHEDRCATRHLSTLSCNCLARHLGGRATRAKDAAAAIRARKETP